MPKLSWQTSETMLSKKSVQETAGKGAGWKRCYKKAWVDLSNLCGANARLASRPLLSTEGSTVGGGVQKH